MKPVISALLNGESGSSSGGSSMSEEELKRRMQDGTAFQMKKGGAVKYKSGGKVRGCGIAQRGLTKGKMR